MPPDRWEDLSLSELLCIRLKDLCLKLEESPVIPFIQRIRRELEAKDLYFLPRFYVGDEWFSPEGQAAVAIPFFLLHPRLMELEKSQILDCEGEGEEEFMRFLRHECGHAFDHAFKVSKRQSWQKVFGSHDQDYHPESYRPRPYSKSYVKNIERWYAQAHPDEDFAETFAVWLDPDSNWSQKYRGWGALKKLEYVDRLAKEFRGVTNTIPKGRLISDVSHLTMTLGKYYERKKRLFAEDYPDFYDRDLQQIFRTPSDLSRAEMKKLPKAHAFMRKHQVDLVETLARWSGEKKYTIRSLSSRLADRCRKLKLVVARSPEATLSELSIYISSLISNYLFTGHFKRRV